jgi:hypothetical protein
MSKKRSSLEDLKQKYFMATHPQEKKMLLAMIKIKDPKFKG